MKRNLTWIIFIVCSLSMGMAAADRDFRYAYVADQSSDTVSVIDRTTNSVVATIGGISGPGGVAITHDGKEVWVVATNEIDVIDTATNTVVSTLPSNNPGLIFPNSVVFSPDDYRAYVVNNYFDSMNGNNGTVSVIDRRSHVVVANIGVGEAPRCIAISPNGKYVYVSNAEDGTVSVIDTKTLSVVTTIPNQPPFFLGGTANGLAVTPNGKYVYVTVGGGDSVTVIDTATNSVSDIISLGPIDIDPCDVAITPNGKLAYVPDCSSNQVTVVDTKTNTILTTISLAPPEGAPTTALGVAMGPFGKHAYVTDVLNNSVYVIDTSSNTVVDDIFVGASPFGIAVRPLP
ncbi:MAG: beta-propeller fold lactonase family protein [Candidatus Acidiferrales bacterium]